MVFWVPDGKDNSLPEGPGVFHARAEAPNANPADAGQQVEATQSNRSRAGGHLVPGEQTLRPTVLRLPSRRPVAPSPSPDPARERGKTRTVYVPQDLVDEVRLWTAEHKRLKTILREVSQLDPGSGPGPRQTPPTPPGATLNIGPILKKSPRPSVTSSPTSGRGSTTSRTHVIRCGSPTASISCSGSA